MALPRIRHHPSNPRFHPGALHLPPEGGTEEAPPGEAAVREGDPLPQRGDADAGRAARQPAEHPERLEHEHDGGERADGAHDRRAAGDERAAGGGGGEAGGAGRGERRAPGGPAGDAGGARRGAARPAGHPRRQGRQPGGHDRAGDGAAEVHPTGESPGADVRAAVSGSWPWRVLLLFVHIFMKVITPKYCIRNVDVIKMERNSKVSDRSQLDK